MITQREVSLIEKTLHLICGWIKAEKKPPQLFISGHSHILKVMPDRHFNLLHINPGAAGNSGIHQVKTAVRLTIDGRDIKDLDIWQAERSRMPL